MTSNHSSLPSWSGKLDGKFYVISIINGIILYFLPVKREQKSKCCDSFLTSRQVRHYLESFSRRYTIKLYTTEIRFLGIFSFEESLSRLIFHQALYIMFFSYTVNYIAVRTNMHSSAGYLVDIIDFLSDVFENVHESVVSCFFNSVELSGDVFGLFARLLELFGCLLKFLRGQAKPFTGLLRDRTRVWKQKWSRKWKQTCKRKTEITQTSLSRRWK